jgi:ABC-type multidrug transport system ATPase subunit
MMADVEPPLSWATRDVLAHSARLLGHSPRSATQLAAQAAEESELSGVLSKRVADLDAAQRRAVQIALAVVGNPPVLALEQPLAGLEPSDRERTIRTLKGVLEGRAAIISAPAMATDPEGDRLLDMMDEVLVMGALGLVARGTFAQLVRSTDSYQVVVSRHCDALCERLVEMGYAARVMTVGDLSVLSVTDTSGRGTAALLGAAHDVDAPVRQLAPIVSALEAP